MKQLIAIMVFSAALVLGKPAVAQQLTFYYYPQQNVYYNPAKKQYIYFSNGVWRPGTALPPAIVVKSAPRVMVYSETPEVWKFNSQHKIRYKNHPNGKAVGHKGTNPNKGKGKARKE